MKIDISVLGKAQQQWASVNRCKHRHTYTDHPSCLERERPDMLMKSPGLKAPKGTKASAVEDSVLEAVRTILAKGPRTLKAVSVLLDRSEATVQEAVSILASRGYNVVVANEAVELADEVAPGAEEPLIIHPLANYQDFRTFGVCGDNHLGSKHERLDVLNTLYDVYEDEGITDVFNTGNWIEGEARFNKYDINVYGMDRQLDYFIENYPERPGITTHFVAGDDHEGWYQQREQVEIGKYAELRAKDQGRDDLHYLGYMEADIELRQPEGSSIMKVMHPGGGSAYALSYAAQKIVESFQGGEKPHVLLYGHYHKFDYNYAREVHCVGTGCTVDQSLFMRKNKIQAHVGGCVVRIAQAPDGTITRFQCEWLPFYDKGFYRNGRTVA
jgi:hypothetical protein